MTQPIDERELQSPLRELLATYDREVRESLSFTLGTTTGTDRVRALHNRLRPSIAVHDAIVDSVLCPLLEDLPDGRVVAERLRSGCRDRASLLHRFETLTKGVAARNVYPASGEEIEHIVQGLDHSFEEHLHDEITELGEVLAGAATSIDPDVVAARMAIEARRAPTRSHRATSAHPRSAVLAAAYRYRDRFADWVDTHHGWSESTSPSPRAQQAEELEHEATEMPPSVADLLAGYDGVVDTLVEEVRSAKEGAGRAEAAHRLTAAIVVHDSVLGGVLCPLVAAVPGGAEVAEGLRRGFRQRAELLMAWKALTRGTSTQDLYRLHPAEADRLVESLTESFTSEECERIPQVIKLLEQLPEEKFRRKTAPFADFMWPWHSEGPSVLALRMAMWAKSSPTRVHPLLVRHPSNRALRSVYHLTDHFRNSWRDTALEKWLFPRLPARPFSQDKVSTS